MRPRGRAISPKEPAGLTRPVGLLAMDRFSGLVVDEQKSEVFATRSQEDRFIKGNSDQLLSKHKLIKLGWSATVGLYLVLLATTTAPTVRAQNEPAPSTNSSGPTVARASNATATSITAATTAATTTTTTTITTTTTTTSTTPTPVEPITMLAPNETSFEPTASSSSLAAAQQHKLRPINFTLVDELFQSTVNESELVRHWKSMDGQFQEGIRSILKLVFPQIVAISQDAKVSGDCSGGILKWILSLRNLRSWAIKMLDATGKPTAGIFEGSLTMFGNHRQCLGIRAPDEDEIEITEQFEEYFRGQFCVLHLRPWLSAKKPFYHLNSTIEPLLRKSYKYYEKTLYDELAEIAIAFNFIDIRMDLCVPSTCTTADIQRVADLLSKKLEMRAKVMRCDIESRESSVTFVQNLDQTTTIWLIGPVGLILITLISTILILFIGSGDNSIDSETQGLNLNRLLYCMSLQGALNNLFACPKAMTTTTDTTTQQLAANHQSQILIKPLPLYGLRNLFIIWFVIVQLTVELKYQYLRESLVLRNMLLSYWPFQIIINTSMIFESLILITAFTYSYTNIRTSARGLLGYIANKYVRLVPSIATLVMVTIVLPSIGITSPVWRNFVETQSSVCKSTGHLDLFFLQNFVSYDKICLPHTWLFCVELQLIALSIPLVLVLQKTFKLTTDSFVMVAGDSQDQPYIVGTKSQANGNNKCQVAAGSSTWRTLYHLLTSRVGLLGVLLVLAGAVGNFALVYMNQLPPAWFHTFPDNEQKKYYFSTYLTKASTHLTTFLIGLYAGHLARSSLPSLHTHRVPSKTTMDTLSNNLDAANVNHPFQSTSSGDGSRSFHNNDNKETRTDYRRISLQLAALTWLVSMVFATYSWSTQELPAPWVAALYDSASRLVWSLALAGLMVQLCRPNNNSNNNGDGAYTWTGLARLFSSPVCIVLGRLSFLAYLCAPLVHTFVLAVQEQSLFPSLYLIFHVMLGNIVITYLVAFVLSIMIEQPIRLVVGELTRCRRRRATTDDSDCGTAANMTTMTTMMTTTSASISSTTNTSATSLAS